MKMSLCLMITMFSFFGSISAQSFRDYKTKTKHNAVQRTEILNKVRNHFKIEYKQTFSFVVNSLNVTEKYAWLTADVVRKDNKQVKVTEHDDCCHAEALLKKVNGKWEVAEASAFSTDVWWENIWERYDVPKELILVY